MNDLAIFSHVSLKAYTVITAVLQQHVVALEPVNYWNLT
jgi:hypothetical protein